MLKHTILCLLASLFFGLGSSSAKPVWAKRAVAFDINCYAPASPAQKILSPDGKIDIEVRCHPAKKPADPMMYLHITEIGGFSQDENMETGAHELLWSPDSKAFLVNGGESAYAGFFVTVYKVENGRVQKLNVTENAQRDMVVSFPPCKAAQRDAKVCARIAKDPEYNVSGLEWMEGSESVIVMAEVPCSSFYGGIMCQVLGYRLQVPSGKILERMTAHELKRRWQKSMAWPMNIPDPASYGAPIQQP
jgi:hypothetical protein